MKRGRKKNYNKDYGTIKSPAQSNDFDQPMDNSYLTSILISSISSTDASIEVDEEEQGTDLNVIKFSLNTRGAIGRSKQLLFLVYQMKTDSDQDRMDTSDNCIIID